MNVVMGLNEVFGRQCGEEKNNQIVNFSDFCSKNVEKINLLLKSGESIPDTGTTNSGESGEVVKIVNMHKSAPNSPKKVNPADVAVALKSDDFFNKCGKKVSDQILYLVVRYQLDQLTMQEWDNYFEGGHSPVSRGLVTQEQMDVIIFYVKKMLKQDR